MESDLFCFFVSGNTDRIFPDSELWKLPLSGKSSRFSIPSKKDLSHSTPNFNQTQNSDSVTTGAVTIGAVTIGAVTTGVLTIGDYLSACKHFLILDDYHHLKLGLKFIMGKTIFTNQFKRIDLFLEKHGAFYHPVKVIVSIKTGQVATLVLNGAVSTKGLEIIENEYSILAKLYHKPGLHRKASLNHKHALCNKPGSFYVPAVFGMDILTESKGKFGFFFRRMV
jgi:hypothetical protein